MVVQKIDQHGGNLGESYKVEPCSRRNLRRDSHVEQSWIVDGATAKAKGTGDPTSDKAQEEQLTQSLLVSVTDVTLGEIDSAVLDLSLLVALSNSDSDVSKADTYEDKDELNDVGASSALF